MSRDALTVYSAFQMDCPWVLVTLHLGKHVSYYFFMSTLLYLCLKPVCKRAEHLIWWCP